jgi:hypothetical protein
MDDMYFVINEKAIALDELGAPIVCDVVSCDDGTSYVDWDSFDLIDWLDLLPQEYQLYKAAVDFLQQNAQQSMYVK